MSNPGLNINKACIEQVESNISLNFDLKTMIPIGRELRKENTHVISLVIFFENRKNKMFNFLISVVYCIMYNYACADYLCFQKTELYFSKKGFEITKFNDI